VKAEYTPDILTASQREFWHPAAPSIWAFDGNPLASTTSAALLRTLFDQPRWLDAYLLYDEKGSQLFERICQLPEYYLTRTEDSILARHAADVIAAAPVDCIVELGAGTAKKTVHLLREQMRQRRGGTFAPIDVSLAGMIASRDAFQHDFPALAFCGLQARFEEGVASIRKSLPTLFLFLGSTVGNLTRYEFVRFFEMLSKSMGPQDFLLLGADCVKEAATLEKAYNDSAGLTAEFILNVFAHINRITGSNFDQSKMRYLSRYDLRWQYVEMSAETTEPQQIHFPSMQRGFYWRKDDPILVEISRKFDPDKLQQQLTLFGLRPIEKFTDPQGWFSLLLFKRDDHLTF
jgi:L-histidine N-alpha-methyltransferase